MLDLPRLQRIALSPKPVVQRIVANLGLVVDYRVPRRTEIVLEGTENIPLAGGAFLAMNHTDRYNYFPLQYRMYRVGLPYTATWVKGKYYENRWMGAFMDATNNIPLPSRGYVITTQFKKAMGRAPNESEYRFLRDVVDGNRDLDATRGEASPDVRKFVGPDSQRFLDTFNQSFQEMMRNVADLNRRAIEQLGLNVLVFPQGTRSKRLSKGHNGLAQMAQHLGAPIIPIGCNGCDRLYPENSPLSKGGRVVYRIGKPLRVDGPELKDLRVPSEAVPLTDETTKRYHHEYTAITTIVMDRINELLDPEYQYAPDLASDGAQGVKRFV